MTEKPRKGDFGELNPKHFPMESMRRTPQEANAFDTSLENRSAFILDPRVQGPRNTE